MFTRTLTKALPTVYNNPQFRHNFWKLTKSSATQLNDQPVHSYIRLVNRFESALHWPIPRSTFSASKLQTMLRKIEVTQIWPLHKLLLYVSVIGGNCKREVILNYHYYLPCACTPSLSLLMTVPSVKRLLLMEAPSFILRPSAPVFAIRSDPAKSTRVRVETQTAPPSADSGSLLLLSTTWQITISIMDL